MLRKLWVLSSLLFALALSAFAQDSRHFTFQYAFTVRNLPAGKRSESGFLQRSPTLIKR